MKTRSLELAAATLRTSGQIASSYLACTDTNLNGIVGTRIDLLRTLLTSVLTGVRVPRCSAHKLAFAVPSDPALTHVLTLFFTHLTGAVVAASASRARKRVTVRFTYVVVSLCTLTAPAYGKHDDGKED